MENNNSLSLQQWCDDLTKKGDKLSVRWGGRKHENGYMLLLNGADFPDYSDHSVQLIALFEDALKTGTFCGEFSTEGQATYDPKSKSFNGYDNYRGERKKISISITSYNF